MARGTQSKTLIGSALLQIFPRSFIDSDGKTIRIPTTCEGEPIEVKIQMTAAKDIVGGTSPSDVVPASQTANPQNKAMTAEEVDEVRELIKRLNL